MRPYYWLLSLICLLCPRPIAAQQRPLKTDDAELVKTGRVRAGFGVEFLQRQRYSLSGLEGDLTRVGVAGIHIGVGEYAEFQISGVVQDFLSVTRRTEPAIAPTFTGDSTSDFGDLVLATKIKLGEEKGLRPALAFKSAVELPNAKHDSGLGNNETEFYAGILLAKHLWKTKVLGNIGFAILPSPVLLGRQSDPLTYGAAVIVPVHRRVNLVAEINGRQGPLRRLGNENQSQVRAGIQLQTGNIRWDLSGIAGLKQYDPKSGLVIGVTYEFQAFQRNNSSIRIK